MRGRRDWWWTLRALPCDAVPPENTELVAPEQLGAESRQHRIADRMASLTARRPKMLLFRLVAALLRSLFLPRSVLLLENAALRHQLSVLQRTATRPRLKACDRLFWVWLSRIWSGWRSCLVIVKPQTVIRWHRHGFRLCWRWRSRPKRAGRPRIDREIRDLIHRMSAPGSHHMRCAWDRAISCAIPVQLRGASDHGLRPELHVSHPCVAIWPSG